MSDQTQAPESAPKKTPAAKKAAASVRCRVLQGYRIPKAPDSPEPPFISEAKAREHWYLAGDDVERTPAEAKAEYAARIVDRPPGRLSEAAAKFWDGLEAAA